MNYKTSRTIMGGFCIAAIPFALLSGAAPVLGIAAAALIGIGVLQTLFFYKCPHCGAQLEPRGPVPKFCPKCGKKLD